MATRKRKLWATRYTHVGAELKRHESQAAAYRWLRELARQWAPGRAQHVKVLVDERLGFGWATYDEVCLAELSGDLPDEPAPSEPDRGTSTTR